MPSKKNPRDRSSAAERLAAHRKRSKPGKSGRTSSKRGSDETNGGSANESSEVKRSGAARGGSSRSSKNRKRSNLEGHLRTRDGGQSKRSRDRAPDVEPMPIVLRAGLAVLLLVAAVWSYWPTLYLLSKEWDRLPDYSHGWLVIPVALVLCYLRRASFPGLAPRFEWLGLVPIALSVAIRWFGLAYFYEFIDGASILFWVLGAVWTLAGWRAVLWALPPIGFLAFMIPLPYTVNLMLSHPLQRVATEISTWVLQLFGQPALAEGNTISLDTHQLEVEQACSGLRIFVGILALAYVFIFMTYRTRLQQALIIASSLPIALAANAIRIVATGMLMQYASSEAAEKFTHDIAGWVMIPLACVFFMLFLWYLAHLFPEEEKMSVEGLRRRGGGPKDGPAVSVT